MQPALKEIKNELAHLDPAELTAICLRLARYKKENKELLNFLLFHAGRPEEYAEEVKESLIQEFKQLNRHDYYAVKTLRKILRLLGKHARFSGSKVIEADLLIWFCINFLTYTNTSSSYKALRTVFLRQLIKVSKLIKTMEEDHGHDIGRELEKVLHWADTSLKGFKRKDVRL